MLFFSQLVLLEKKILLSNPGKVLRGTTKHLINVILHMRLPILKYFKALP